MGKQRKAYIILPAVNNINDSQAETPCFCANGNRLDPIESYIFLQNKSRNTTLPYRFRSVVQVEGIGCITFATAVVVLALTSHELPFTTTTPQPTTNSSFASLQQTKLFTRLRNLGKLLTSSRLPRPQRIPDTPSRRAITPR